MNIPVPTPSLDSTIPRWHVMTGRAIDKRQGRARLTLPQAVEAFNRDNGSTIELFAPTIVTLHAENSSPRRVSRPLVGNYVFLRSTVGQLKEFRQSYPLFNPVIDHASAPIHRYLAVPDPDMKRFMNLAALLSHKVPCYSPEEIDLEKGDYVAVVGGPFQGMEGTLVTQQGSDGGRVAINIANRLLAVTYRIEPRYLKIIRFAKGNKHIYDRLDAFAMRLRNAIREHADTGTLSLASTAALGYFVDRFGNAEITGAKTRCRFQAHLMAAYHLLGDTAMRDTAMNATQILLPAVTNSATAAAIHLLLYLCSRHPKHLQTASEMASHLRPTPANARLFDDIRFYTASTNLIQI